MKKIVLMIMMAMAVFTTNAQSEYPTSKVEKHDVAILIIDMQNDFVDPKGKLCVAGAKATVPAINKLIAYGRSKNWKVVWITLTTELRVLTWTLHVFLSLLTAKQAIAFPVHGASYR